MEVAGKVTGILVFLAGVVLLGLVFVYTIRTIDAAERGLRQGDLVLRPLFGDEATGDAPNPATPYMGAPGSESGAPDTADRDGKAETKELSPILLFAMALGARVLGLCVLGFLAGVIATQGARLAGASRSLGRREWTE